MTHGQSQVKLLTINQFADVCYSTPRTLRFYEQKDLIKPYKIGRFNSYRYYHPSQARDFFKLKLLQNFQINLKDIKLLVRKNKTQGLLSKKLLALRNEIQEKEKQLRFLENIHTLLFDQASFDKAIKLENFGPYLLFCMTVSRGDYHQIGSYLENLWSVAKKLKLKFLNQDLTFYFDYQYTPKGGPIELAIICKNPSKILPPLPSGYYFRKFPKQKVLIFTFTGPYSYLSLAHQRFDEYINQTGTKVKGSVFEQYLDNPTNQSCEYQYVTKIYYPF